MGLLEWDWYDPRSRPLPAPVAGVFDFPTRRVCLNIDWIQHIAGVLDRLAQEDVWEGTEAQKFQAVQQMYLLARALGGDETINPCHSEDGVQERCAALTLAAQTILPNNPWTDPLPDVGAPAWLRYNPDEQFPWMPGWLANNLLGLRPGDLLTSLWAAFQWPNPAADYPRLSISTPPGTRHIDLELLELPAGGQIAVQQGLRVDVHDTAAPTLSTGALIELVLDGELVTAKTVRFDCGPGTVNIWPLPVLSTGSIVGFGAGIRSIRACGDVSQEGAEMPYTLRVAGDGCTLELVLDTMVVSAIDLAQCAVPGPAGPEGERGPRGLQGVPGPAGTAQSGFGVPATATTTLPRAQRRGTPPNYDPGPFNIPARCAVAQNIYAMIDAARQALATRWDGLNDLATGLAVAAGIAAALPIDGPFGELFFGGSAAVVQLVRWVNERDRAAALAGWDQDFADAAFCHIYKSVGLNGEAPALEALYLPASSADVPARQTWNRFVNAINPDALVLAAELTTEAPANTPACPPNNCNDDLWAVMFDFSADTAGWVGVGNGLWALHLGDGWATNQTGTYVRQGDVENRGLPRPWVGHIWGMLVQTRNGIWSTSSPNLGVGNATQYPGGPNVTHPNNLVVSPASPVAQYGDYGIGQFNTTTKAVFASELFLRAKQLTGTSTSQWHGWWSLAYATSVPPRLLDVRTGWLIRWGQNGNQSSVSNQVIQAVVIWGDGDCPIPSNRIL